MANALYDRGREAFLNGEIHWTSDDIKAVLVDSSAYTPNLATDQYLNDIPAFARTATADIRDKTTLAGGAHADDVVFPNVSGRTSKYVVLYKNTGAADASPLICLIDTATGLPVTPDGQDITVQWDKTSHELFKLNAEVPAAGTVVTTRPIPPSRAGHNLGTNLNELTDWSSTAWVTTNVMKGARSFISGVHWGTWDDGRSLNLDPDGYPQSLAPDQVARVVMFTSMPFPHGNYVLKYDGEGTIEVASGAAVLSNGPGRIVCNVTGPWQWNIIATTPGNHLRNIRIYPEALEDDPRTWNPDWVATLTYYKALRFMDFLRTNGNPIVSWADRPLMSHAVWTTPAGIPVEALVELANTLGLDPWFCMPHAANDDYFRQFATVVRDNLHPSLRPYVEYSNEVWNWAFPQSQYAVAQANADPGRFGSDGAGYQRFYAARSVDVFDAFAAVYGARSKFRAVLAWQAGFDVSWYNSSGAPFLPFDFENAHQKADAFAIAPYFGSFCDAQVANGTITSMSLDDFFALLESGVDDAIAWTTRYKTLADARGKPLIAYEGGQTMGINSGTDAQIAYAIDKETQMQTDPRMGNAYARFFTAWSTITGDALINHFLDTSPWGRFGFWGARPSSLDPIDASYPKALFLKNYAMSTGIQPQATVRTAEAPVASHGAPAHG